MLKNIGVIGDSIAHGYCDASDLGWFARLGQMILSKHGGEYLFNNMSQAGDNIADAVNRSFYEVLTRRFDLILVNIGINDLRRRKDSNLQLDFSEGLRLMYWNRLLDVLLQTKAQIVVLDLIPVIEKRYTSEASLVRYNADVEKYNTMLQSLCAQRNIHFFPRYAEWVKRDLEALYQDATHPNSEGHQIFAEEVFAFLEAQHLL